MSKALAYQGWLNQLKETPNKSFFSMSEDFLHLLENENPTKINLFEKEFKKRAKILNQTAEKAIKELNPLYLKIKKAVKKSKKSKEELKPINRYEDYLAKKVIVTPEDPVDELYFVIRFALEIFVKSGRLKGFKRYMKKANNNYYLESKNFPAYLKYLDTRDHIKQEKEETAFGAYDYLKNMIPFLKPLGKDDSSFTWVRAEVVTRFTKLILYLTTPQPKTKAITRPTLGLKGLFSLSEHPPRIFYEGTNKEERGEKPTKGKTQTYSILHYFAKKAKEKPEKEETRRLALPAKAILDFISKPENCDHPPSWEQIVSSKRMARNIVKNARKAVGFTEEELFVEETQKGLTIVLQRVR